MLTYLEWEFVLISNLIFQTLLDKAFMIVGNMTRGQFFGNMKPKGVISKEQIVCLLEPV